ncbi:MAG: ATP-binding protein [Prevotella sp.]|nr:ATP-binding protein [Prevotella sp.]
MEKTIERVQQAFPCVVITGPRQVGKTTMLQNKVADFAYVTCDDYSILETAQNNPSMFLNIFQPPLIIDELQYAPNILHGIKKYVDETKRKGQIFITGSQSFHLMANVTESLAGRAAILQMLGFSAREIQQIDYHEPFLPTVEHWQAMKTLAKPFDYWQIWQRIQQGSFPEVIEQNKQDKYLKDFYNAYVRTYIERDIKKLINVHDENAFIKFIKAVAGLTGQMLNYATIADICGKNINTVKSWLSILISSGIVYLLQPYANNLNKRLTKTPKLYFLDTGLACYLTSWHTKEQLADGAMRGPMFETYVVGEILKSYYNDGITEPPLFYYRDKEKNEIDLVIESDGNLYPVEIKCKSNPTKDDIAAFVMLQKFAGKNVMPGCVICLADKVGYVDDKNFVLPVTLI